MKKTLSLLAVLMAAGVASTPAQAATHYVSGLAGISWFQNSDVEHTTTYDDDNFTEQILFDSGFTCVAAIGCDYGDTRLEAEIGYQRNGTGDNSQGIDNSAGKASVYSLMANGFYDIPLGGGAELYAMAGVGVAQVNRQDSGEQQYFYGEDQDVPSSGYTDVTWKSHETTLAYQLGAGIAVPISKGVMLDARYRYFATTDFTFEGREDTYPLNEGNGDWSTGYADTSYNSNVSSHSVLLGLRVDL